MIDLLYAKALASLILDAGEDEKITGLRYNALLKLYKNSVMGTFRHATGIIFCMGMNGESTGCSQRNGRSISMRLLRSQINAVM